MVKVVFDVLVAITLLIVLTPILLALAALTLYFHSKTILFVQRRLMLNSYISNIYKFRTMTNECDVNGEPLPDAQRLTNFGKWMHTMSLKYTHAQFAI